MSDLFSPTSPDASDEGKDDDQAMQFARCSQVPSDPLDKESTEVREPKKETEDKKKKVDCEGKTPNSASVAEKLPLHRDNASNPPNVRRTHLALRHWVISLCASAVVGLVALYVGKRFYEKEVLPKLTGAVVPAQTPTDSAGSEALVKASEQIAALQKQVDVMRREQLLMQQNTRESLESISSVLKDPKLAQAPAVDSSAQPGVARMAEMRPDISPTQQEFIQLKERNRLTQYADEAIATGMRRPLELLVEYMRDSQLEHLHDAAQAEYMRAVRSIQLLQREDPGYRLPVAELFKDSSIRDEADVKPEALLKLLADYKQPWEVRLRVCFLLLGSNLPETNATLIKAIKEDPSLDVAKHAQLALEQRIKKRFRIFDIPAIEDWFKSQAK
ncbi:hypothetical protein [Prosthecobacter sp.]|uniref:hypothetical protein n=1 Tax=Prosthecobacter sp. TaxID=1965333 RepID=UPI001D22727C|nr:hypothetical protein [Prosthecobacter sp.]MCB1278258.1 hypothetical protein [Prosthecobacter sp.]